MLRRYERPFSVEKRIGKLAYRVKLPHYLECHSMFHVSFLKPYYPDESDPSQNKSQRVLIAVFAVLDHDMEVIITHQAIPRKGVPCTPFKEYLVKWKGLPNA